MKRLMREALELKDPTSDYFAQPLSDNLFEWHFTVRGPSDTEFDGGIYHGRIILPTDYPMKPPHIIVLTPNGRFETGKKICLSISGHHPESWQPSWSIRTALLAIIGFMPTPGQGTIGSLDYPKSERVKLAKKSVSFICKECCSDSDSTGFCKPVSTLLKDPDPEGNKTSQEVDDIKKMVMLGAKSEGETNKVETKQEIYIRKRKEASAKMQQKFREKLLARTPQLVKQVEQQQQLKSKPTSRLGSAAAATPGSAGDASATAAAATSSSPANRDGPSQAGQQPARTADHQQLLPPRGGDDGSGGSYIVEILIALIVIVIAAVFYRRSVFFQRLLFGTSSGAGGSSVPSTTNHENELFDN